MTQKTEKVIFRPEDGFFEVSSIDPLIRLWGLRTRKTHLEGPYDFLLVQPEKYFSQKFNYSLKSHILLKTRFRGIKTILKQKVV